MNRKSSRGVTLIELMVGLSVAAVLIALGSPSFVEAINGNKLSSAAGEVTAALQLARSEAIRFNRRVVLCRSDDGSSCDTAAGDWGGWIVFMDANGNGARDSAEPVIKAGTIDSPLQLLSSNAVSSGAQRFTFRGDGTARTATGTLLAGTLSVCIPTTQPAQNMRLVSLAFGSRTALARASGGGLCSIPSDT